MAVAAAKLKDLPAKRALTAIEAERMRRSLEDFIAGAWHIVDPSKFRNSWHVGAIAEHVCAVITGEINDLIINIPPRTSKSRIVSVMTPAWSWIDNPELRWLYSSYNKDLSIRDSVDTKMILMSDWYRERWGDSHRIIRHGDTQFRNDKGGGRQATSVDAAATGFGGDIIVVDDPHSAKEAYQPNYLETVWRWWTSVMSTRLNNAEMRRRIVIAQRIHMSDLCGRLIDQGGWEHLNLPMEYDPARSAVTKIGFEDPRTKAGELLCPDRMGQEYVDARKNEMTEQDYSAQFQQLAVPEGGTIIKAEWWREWKHPDLPKLELVIQSYDTNLEPGEENDQAVRTTWGIFLYEPMPGESPNWPRYCAMLLEKHAWKPEYPDLRDEAIESYHKWKPDRVLIEKRVSGHSLLQELRRSGIPVVEIAAPGGRQGMGKVTRAKLASLMFRNGCVFYKKRKWVKAVIEEIAQFPFGRYRDTTDSVTQAVMWLRKEYHMDLHDEEPEDFPQEEESRPIYG